MMSSLEAEEAAISLLRRPSSMLARHPGRHSGPGPVMNVVKRQARRVEVEACDSLVACSLIEPDVQRAHRRTDSRQMKASSPLAHDEQMPGKPEVQASIQPGFAYTELA